MGGDGIPRVTKLGTGNYLQWALELEAIMQFKGCWAAVVPDGSSGNVVPVPRSDASLPPPPRGGDVKAEPGTQEALPTGALPGTDHDKEHQARALMVMNVEPQHQATLRLHPTARGAWEAFKTQFASDGPARLLHLRRQLNTLQMGPTEPAVVYFNRARTIVWELGELGVEIDDGHLLSALLAGLPTKHEQTRHILSLQRGLTVDQALQDLQAMEAYDVLHNRNAVKDGSALIAASGGGRRTTRSEQEEIDRQQRNCYLCHKPGHIRRRCPQRGTGGGRGGDGHLGAANAATTAHESDGDGAVPDGAAMTSIGGLAMLALAVAMGPGGGGCSLWGPRRVATGQWRVTPHDGPLLPSL